MDVLLVWIAFFYLKNAKARREWKYCFRPRNRRKNDSSNGGEASEFWGGPNPYAPLTSTPFTPSLRSPAHFFP